MTTAGSSGLNNLISSTDVTQTTLPSWYDAAQQNVVSQAGTAAQAAPTFGQSTSQQAVNTLQGSANPFTQAQSTLGTIAQGAANPWITNADGSVSPNNSTALGGLFQAENQQLNQILPTAIAGAQGNAIGTGNFMSSQGQGAVATAKANAQANLLSQQMAAALQNQQTGTTAATGLGNVGAQNINAALTTGTAQQNAPFQTAGNYANLINSINVPGTVSDQTQQSPLQAAATIGTALQGGLSALNSTSTGASLLKSLGLSGLVAGSANSGSGSNSAVAVDTSSGVSGPNGTILSYGSPVTGTGAGGGAGAGQVLGTDGKVYNDPTYGTGSTSTTATTDPSIVGTPVIPDPNVSDNTSDPTSPDYMGT
jgi:hypothetical protein